MQFCLLGLAQAVVHGSEHGLAGQGRAGNSIHAVGGTSLGQGICQGLGSSAAQLRGLAGSINGHFAHLAAGNSHGDLHIAQAALSAGSIGAVGQVLCACRAGAGLRQAAVHGGEHSIAGEGRAGNGVHTGSGTGLGQLICQGLSGSTAQLRGLTGSVDGHIGHLAAGDGDGDGHLAQAALLTGGVGAVGQRSRVVGSGHGAGVLDVQAQHHCHDDSDDGHNDDVAGHCLLHKKSDAPFDLTG